MLSEWMDLGIALIACAAVLAAGAFILAVWE